MIYTEQENRVINGNLLLVMSSVGEAHVGEKLMLIPPLPSIGTQSYNGQGEHVRIPISAQVSQ